MKIALVGYGKMGHIIEEQAKKRGHEIVATIDINNYDDIKGEAFKSADVAIEFSRPESAVGNILNCFAAGVPVVSGTTGWTKEMDKVKEESRNPNITKDGKKTYSDQYDKLKKELAEGPQRLELVPAVYGMGRASEGNFYYMTLKLLMTREVVALLQRHKLSIVQSDTGYAPEPSLQYMDIRERDSLPKVRASLCTVLPVRAYTLREGEQPYLLEVPFKATIRGAMGNFTAFVRDLQAEGRFFVLTNLEMQTDKPVLLNMRRDQLIKSQETEKGIRIETVTATIKCSGFALPEVDRMDEALKQRSRDWVKERPQAPVEKPIGI